MPKKQSKPEQKAQKPSQFINQMVEMMVIKPIKTGNHQLDIVLRQLQFLAAHADATDAFLDAQFSDE